MELTELLLIMGVNAMLCLVLSVLSAVVVRILLDKRRDSRIAYMEDDIESLKMTKLSEKGQVAKAEKAERVQMAMAELALLVKDGKMPEKATLLALAAKYPDVALTHGAKLLKGLKL